MSDTDGTDNFDAANETEAQIRRAPKFPAFMIVGGGLGAIVTFIATALNPVDPAVGFAALFGYFALYGVTAGVVIGGVIALILDRVGTRRARPATIVTEAADPDVDAAAAAQQAKWDAEDDAAEAAERAAAERAKLDREAIEKAALERAAAARAAAERAGDTDGQTRV
jgi:hypothetical protein